MNIQADYIRHARVLHQLGLPLLEAIAELRSRFAGEVSLTQAHEWAAEVYMMMDQSQLQVADQDIGDKARALYAALVKLGWTPPA